MITYENMHYGNNKAVTWYHPRNLNFPNHLHRSYELIDMLDGALSITVNKQTYQLHKDDMMLILPYEIHSIRTDGSSYFHLSLFSPDYIPDFTKAVSGHYLSCPCFHMEEAAKQLFMKPLFYEGSDIWKRKAAYYYLCACIKAQADFIPIYKNHYSELHEVLIYIQEHFTDEDISLKKIAEQFGYNYSYLSRSFSRLFSCSFTEYLNQTKINYAASLLIDTDRSITEIAYECGYKTIRSFNRNFVNIQKTAPKAFRKQK